MTVVFVEGVLEPLAAGTPQVYHETIVLVVEATSTEAGSTG